MAALRAEVEPNNGRLRGPAARAPFHAIMSRIVAPADAIFRDDQVGEIPGGPRAATHQHGRDATDDLIVGQST